MAETILRFEALGYREAKGRFAKRTDQLASRMRDGVRDISRSMVSTLMHYAPRKTGQFAEGIRFRTIWHGEAVQSHIYVTGDHAYLLPFLVEGTKPHLIPKGGAAEMKAKGYPLHWVGDSGGHHFAWQVWHPGTLPDPFVALSLEAMDPQFEMATRSVAREIAWLS